MDVLVNKRLELQEDVTRTIIEKDYNGIIDISPRTGKSKMIIDAIRDKVDWNIHISCPRIPVVESWEKEFDKWELGFPVELSCHKSLKKVPEEIDLLIIDEVHKLSQNQKWQILKKRPKRLLLVSGSMTGNTIYDLMYLFKTKVIYTYSINQAIEDEIISNFEIILIPCKLDNQRRNIESGTKKQPDVKTELGHYNWLTSKFERFKELGQTDPSWISYKDYYVRQRKDFIYKSLSKLFETKKILRSINRALVFTGFIEQAEMLCLHSFHSKNKQLDNLSKFINGEINHLSVIGTVDEGVTFNDLKTIVVHQLQSNPESAIQKFLRACNLDGDRKAKIYILYYENTVDENWVKEALKDIKKDKIKRLLETVE